MFKKIGLTGLALSPLSAFAAIDLTPITAAGVDVMTVGMAVFAVFVAVAAVKFIRKAL